ncbi:Multidrug resistance protein 1 [Boothiomyces sp. JEL0866]|nr:Multidrug resistance protein 1 [Boothiomyces sp. JEL0866]
MTIFFGQIIQSFVSYQPGDQASLDKMNSDMSFAVTMMCIIGVVTFVGSYVQMTCWILFGENVSKRIRESFFHSILRQDIAWFDATSTGDLNSRLTADINIIQEGLSDKVGLLIQFSCAFVAGYIIAFVRGWRLALVLLATLPFLSGAAFLMSKILSGGQGEEQDAYAGAGAIAQQTFTSIRTVVSFGGQDKEAAKYAKHLDTAEKAGIKKALSNGAGIGFFQFLMFNIYALTFWYGNTLVPDTMSTGDVLNVFFAIIIGSFSLGNATPHITAIASALGAAKGIFETIDRVSPIDALSLKGEKLESAKQDIEFKDVDFHYPSRKDVPILKKFNLKVKTGQTVALVGLSGSGKSTIVKLLERFYDPANGSVLLGSSDIRNLNISWLRSNIGMVTQEPVLFDTTIRENIILGLDSDHVNSPDLSDRIENACRQANCWDFIQKLPDKLDTKVGDAGGMLSGGQKQRIAIARAIIKNPSIILLDEATSALDTESERVVQAALETASANRTTIIIAHRLSTVKNANLIVVMDAGEIIEQGTHAELLEKKGNYYNLVQAQELKTENGAQSPQATAASPKIEASQPGKLDATTPDKGVVVLSLEKDEAKSKNVDGKLDYGRLMAYNKPEYGLMALGIFGALCNGGVQPVFAIVFSKVLTILGTSLTNTYALIFVGLACGAFITNFLQLGLLKYCGEKMTRRVRYQVFLALLKQEIAFFDMEENSAGALTSKLSEEANLVMGLTGPFFGAVLQSIAGVLVGLIIAFISCWQLSLVILGMVPLIAAAGYMQLQALVGFGSKTKAAYETASQKASEAIQTIRTVAVLNKEEVFYKRYLDSIVLPHQITIKGAFLTSGGFAFSQSVLHFAWAVSFYYGSRLVVWGLYSTGDVFRAIFTIIFTAMLTGQVNNHTPDAAKAKLAAFSIFAILDRKSSIDPNSDVGEKKEKVEGNVSVRNARFTYPARPDIEVLKGLSLDAFKGKTVALVGQSGCGKSTVMGLLERWYDPSSGTITFDNTEIDKWNVKNLRSHMAIVGQEPVLFNVSIRDNIAYGAIGPVDELAIQEAAKLANIHEFIIGLPDKYDTLVGEKGGQISGGQKQRIAIARALIRDPRLLLLDEATSALDSESEKIVQEALDIAAKGRTTIVIAHRLSTIQNADIIIVVGGGTVIESGTHFELLELQGSYYQLVNQQKLN